MRSLDRWCLAVLAKALAGVPVRIVLWDQNTEVVPASPPVATVRVLERRALIGLLRQPDLAFGEGYMLGRIEAEGDLVELFTAVAGILEARRSPRLALLRPRGGGLRRATRDARYHYDLGNDFYRLWLDDQLVYTCAYFPNPTATLEAAQRAKFELVARKLALRPGERVYEAGCGWGALALHLAREHGVTVRAWNISHEQVAWARNRAREQGLADRVEFLEEDYRRIDGVCDAFVSVGMLEHVGIANYAAIGEIIDRSLHPDHGRGLLHFIGRNFRRPMGKWITRYIFPGAYLPTLPEVLADVLAPHGFSVLDVENLRRHYSVTLAHWLERFERVAPWATQRFGEVFTRMWRLYLAEAQAGFRSGSLQLFQVSFARSHNDGTPWTRAPLYRDEDGRTEPPA